MTRLEQARERFLDALDDLKEFAEKHPKFMSKLQTLMKRYNDAMKAYDRALREYAVKKEVKHHVEPNTGVSVTLKYGKPKVNFDLLFDLVPPEELDDIVDEKIVYTLKDPTGLDSLVARHVLSLRDYERVVSESKPTVAVQFPKDLKDPLNIGSGNAKK